MNTKEQVDEILKLYETEKQYNKIKRLRDHIDKEIQSAYGHKLAIWEGYTEGDMDEQLEDLIGDLLKGLVRAIELRNHKIHEWEDIYGDGRDLSCVCRICGAQET